MLTFAAGVVGAQGTANVATVGPMDISAATYARWYAVADSPEQGGGGTAGEIREQVMQFLITGDWLEGQAAAQGIHVSESAIAAQFKTLVQQQFPKRGELGAFLRSSRMTIPDLLYRIKLDMLSTAIQQSITTTPTTAQIAAYYAANLSQFAVPETRDLRVILTRTRADALAAISAIHKGATFAQVAHGFSIDAATKQDGGVIDGATESQLVVPLGKAVFAAAPGVLSGPVRTHFGYYVFRVEEIHPAGELSLVQATGEITQLLEEQQVVNFVTQFNTTWKAKTSCLPAYMMDDCGHKL